MFAYANFLMIAIREKMKFSSQFVSFRTRLKFYTKLEFRNVSVKEYCRVQTALAIHGLASTVRIQFQRNVNSYLCTVLLDLLFAI